MDISYRIENAVLLNVENGVFVPALSEEVDVPLRECCSG